MTSFVRVAAAGRAFLAGLLLTTLAFPGCVVVKKEPPPVHWPTLISDALHNAENDLDMLQFAGLGIATANCTPGLKKAFNNISRWTNDEDMVARELDKLKGN